MEEEKKSVDSSVDNDKVFAVLSYFWILFILPLVMKKDSEFAVYHAKQGLILFIFSIIIGVASNIPFIGWFIIAPVGGVIGVILFIIGIINAWGGKKQPLPIIGKYADSFKF